MRHSFFASRKPLVFAHRGGGALAPENTIAAFDNAVSLGVDGLELDVHLSRDGVVVVHHDRTLTRTTGLPGLVAGRSAAELATLDAGATFAAGGARPYAGLGIGVPRLDEVLARYANHRVIIELKANTAELGAAVVDVVRRCDAVERVCVGAFALKGLRAVRAGEPALATSAAREEVRWALYRSWCRWPVRNPGYGGYQVPELAGRTRVVSPRFVADAHATGLAVQVWTVDTEPDARRLLSWNVDALITDRPDLIRSLTESL